jgi:hypothetical protein
MTGPFFILIVALTIILLAGIFKFSGRVGSNARRRIQEGLSTPQANPALDQIRSIPQTKVTKTLIAALPNLSLALITEARRFAGLMGANSELLAECILDLELLGGFERVVKYTNDRELASALIDAVVFEVTGKDPSNVPGDEDIKINGTQRYRGIIKYKIAQAKFGIERAWLFGKEYSWIRSGNAMDIAYVGAVREFAAHILQTGALLFDLIDEMGTVGRLGNDEALPLEKVLSSIDRNRANEVCARWLKEGSPKKEGLTADDIQEKRN